MKLYLLIILLILSAGAYGQQTSTWAKMTPLFGEWKGEGSGEPGQGAGGFTFKLDLDGKVLVRKAHTEYAATADKPAAHHDDLMVVYLDSGSPSKAVYFDNEGHVLNYSITYSDKKIVFLTDKAANAPIFRLSYTLLDPDTVDVTFEMSPDGLKYMMYAEGKCKRVK